MLLLTRKNQQAINIGKDIVVTVLDIGGGRIKLGIEAPAQVRVDRAENASCSCQQTPRTAAPRIPEAFSRAG